MNTLFDHGAREDVTRRLGSLRADTVRQWGKMEPAQMLAHCAVAVEIAAGEKVYPRAFLGRILGPLVRPKMLGDRPYAKDSLTGPMLLIRDRRDFDAEMVRLLAVLNRFI